MCIAGKALGCEDGLTPLVLSCGKQHSHEHHVKWKTGLHNAIIWNGRQRLCRSCGDKTADLEGSVGIWAVGTLLALQELPAAVAHFTS